MGVRPAVMKPDMASQMPCSAECSTGMPIKVSTPARTMPAAQSGNEPASPTSRKRAAAWLRNSARTAPDRPPKLRAGRLEAYFYPGMNLGKMTGLIKRRLSGR